MRLEGNGIAWLGAGPRDIGVFGVATQRNEAVNGGNGGSRGPAREQSPLGCSTKAPTSGEPTHQMPRGSQLQFLKDRGDMSLFHLDHKCSVVSVFRPRLTKPMPKKSNLTGQSNTTWKRLRTQKLCLSKSKDCCSLKWSAERCSKHVVSRPPVGCAVGAFGRESRSGPNVSRRRAGHSCRRWWSQVWSDSINELPVRHPTTHVRAGNPLALAQVDFGGMWAQHGLRR